jgi:PAS domain S-box-containing protein
MSNSDKSSDIFFLNAQDHKELLKSEERFRRITERLTDYLYTVIVEDGRAVQTTHSPACAAVTGYTAEEFASDPFLWINMVVPEDRELVLEQVRQTLAGKMTPPVEHRIIRKDGVLRWVMNTIVPSLDEQGRLQAYDGLIKDITERKEMEEKLRQSESRVRTKLSVLLSPQGDIGSLDLEDIINIHAFQSLMNDFYNLTKIGSAIVDIKGKILVATGWQDICTRFHRKHPETRKNCIESDIFLSDSVSTDRFNLYKCKNNMWDMATPIFVGGKHLGNIFLGQFLFADEEPDIELFKSQARRYGFDEHKYLEALKRVPRFSRETVDLAMTFYTRLANLISELSFGHIKLAWAMNEKTKAEKKLKKSNYQLKQALADKDKFFSIIAHDLRSPFIGFHNFIQLMDKHIDSMSQEDIRKLTRDMKKNADNLYNLLNNLLEWARVKRGLISYDPCPLKLDEIVRLSLDLIEPGAAQKNISLDVSVPQEITILADKPMVFTVIRNILSNAVKYTRKQGIISIMAQCQKSMVMIAVKDNGLGMDEKTISALFTQGQKFSLQGTEGETGTGLGLLLCREFIEKHGGRIWAESQHGQGSTFYFTLPAYEQG